MSHLLFFIAGLLLAVAVAVATGSIRDGMDIPRLRMAKRANAEPERTDPVDESIEWIAYDRAHGLPNPADESPWRAGGLWRGADMDEASSKSDSSAGVVRPTTPTEPTSQ